MDGQGLDFLAGLRSALGVECPECGEVNPGSAEYCEACGAPMPYEEEEESFSIVHAEGVAGEEPEVFPEDLFFIDLNREENLAFLQETINNARDGGMSYADYQARIKKVEATAISYVDKFCSRSVAAKADLMPEMKRNLFLRMTSYLEEYLKGCSRMREYDGGADGTAAMEGILAAERALNNLAKFQKKAQAIGS